MIRSLNEIKPARAILLTDIEFECPFFEVIKIDKITSKEVYSDFVVKTLSKYFDTSHVLLIQHDGFILNGDLWDNEFLNWDYIGAKWKIHGEYGVGNGGFSLRSKTLMDKLSDDDFIVITHPEDEITCVLYATYLKSIGIKYAPVRVADKFSYELISPNRKTFGFHGGYHPTFKTPVILKRTAAMGDIIMLEPVMDWVSKQGWQVFLDIDPKWMPLFAYLSYGVRHISELVAAEMPIGFDFDMAYENKPNQLVLKSYYEHVDIHDGEIRNANLNLTVDEETRLFRRYAIVHINKTNMPYRNIYDVNWKALEIFLQKEGYEVIQIGDDSQKCGTWVNTQNLQTLIYVIGGASLFIGSDSGPSHIAVGCKIPSLIFFGSVLPQYRFANFDNIEIAQGFCEKAGCYHSVVGVSGTPCLLGQQIPQCSRHKTKNIFDLLHRLIYNNIQVRSMRIDIKGIHGSYKIYMDIMESLCGPNRGSMIDLGCNLAPCTPLLKFERRKYIDILPRVLDHKEEQVFFEQDDILTFPVRAFGHFDTAISSDVIEHVTDKDGWTLLARMQEISDRQILFTPLDDTFGFDHDTDNPETHRSIWKPEQFSGYASIVLPNYHPTLNAGAFFVWRCDNIEEDFNRVVSELKQKSLSWPKH